MLYTNPVLEGCLQTAQTDPHKKIIIETSGKSATAADLATRSLHVALNLKAAGFKKGDKVLILVRPCIELVVFILAVMRAGGISVIADPGMGKEGFNNRVVLAKPSWIFSESVVFALQQHPLLLYVVKKRGFEIPEISSAHSMKKIQLGFPFAWPVDALLYKHLEDKTATLDQYKSKNLELSDSLLIVFTSGTTDKPKGVVHTVNSLSNTLKKIAEVCKPDRSDIFDASLPHFLLLAVSLGVPAVLSNEKFSAKKYFSDLEKYKQTILFGPPAEFIELIRYCQQNNTVFPSFVKKIFLGSAPVLSGFLQKLLKYIPKHTEITCLYGMTELLPIAIVDGRKKAIWDGDGDLLGNLIPDVKHSSNSDGSMVFNAPHLFDRYLGKPKAHAVDSGDIGVFLKGQLILKGRKKDMIIRGNYNIYPELYESIIQKIPGVAAVAMVGVRDTVREDERVILVVEPEDMLNIKLKRLVEKSLITGKYSIDSSALPDSILIMKIPRFGRQSKINKQHIRDMLADSQ